MTRFKLKKSRLLKTNKVLKTFRNDADNRIGSQPAQYGTLHRKKWRT